MESGQRGGGGKARVGKRVNSFTFGGWQTRAEESAVPCSMVECGEMKSNRPDRRRNGYQRD